VALLHHPVLPTEPSESGSVASATMKATNIASLVMPNEGEAPEIGLSWSPPAIFDDRDSASVQAGLLDMALLVGKV
jgi:hypothetical protein